MEELSFKACAAVATLFLYGAVWSGGDDNGARSAKRVRVMPGKRVQKSFVSKCVLDNGMTVLVRPQHSTPTVSVHLTYNVGSRDEKDGQRGMAHLIEHMMFKGTPTLSETDLPAVVQKLSGKCNAFTSKDRTTYSFDLPARHWRFILPILADCMCNASFRQELLDSELKVVVRELREGDDESGLALTHTMERAIFAGHPYCHPIIGYRHDLQMIDSAALKKFFSKHYRPDQAVLVVVGDVTVSEVVAEARHHFGNICAGASSPKPVAHYRRNMTATQVSLSCGDTPGFSYAYLVPGVKDGCEHRLRLLERIMGRGRSSRLCKKLVEEKKLVRWVKARTNVLFDHGLLYISFAPLAVDVVPLINEVIQEAFDEIATDGVTDEELERALAHERKKLCDTLESNHQQAEAIGRYHLAMGDGNYPFICWQESMSDLADGIQSLVAECCHESEMHSGMVLPLDDESEPLRKRRRAASEADEEEFFAQHQRVVPVEPLSYAHSVVPRRFAQLVAPRPQRYLLENGLRVLSHHNSHTPKIELLLNLKAGYRHDPRERQGALLFISRMMKEGTLHYPGQRLVEALESRGIKLSIAAGQVSMSLLRDDLPFALDLLCEMLTCAAFDRSAVQRVRERMLVDIEDADENGILLAEQIARDTIYPNHPYSNNVLGSKGSLKKLTHRELLRFYRAFITPVEARLAIVGDLAGHDVYALLRETLGKWRGNPLPDLTFPVLSPVESEVIERRTASQQVALCFAGHSVSRDDPACYSLLLFDQIFGNGALDSLSNSLFKLREQTGLFYSINGSLLEGMGKQPAMAQVEALVSPSDVDAASQAIRQTIDVAGRSVTQQELDEARNALVRASFDFFDSNINAAATLILLDKLNLPYDHFTRRMRRMAKITPTQVQEAVGKVLRSDKMVEIRVGRVGPDSRESSVNSAMPDDDDLDARIRVMLFGDAHMRE